MTPGASPPSGLSGPEGPRPEAASMNIPAGESAASSWSFPISPTTTMSITSPKEEPAMKRRLSNYIPVMGLTLIVLACIVSMNFGAAQATEFYTVIATTALGGLVGYLRGPGQGEDA